MSNTTLTTTRSRTTPLERQKEMKLSVKFREETDHQNPLVRAKIPVTILGLPFLLGIAAGDSSDLSFSLRSNFTSGPSLSLSYRPTVPNATQNYPLSVSLKSGIGVFGSPQSSPLIFAANFNFFSTSNPNPNPLIPTFSLQVRPKFGDFSLFKSVSSCDSSTTQNNGNIQNGDSSNGSLSDSDISEGRGLGSPGKQLSWKDLRSDSSCGGLLSGFFLAAKTCMPLAKRAVVNFRWGVSFPPECDWKAAKTPLPMLVVNKISLEKVDAKKGEEGKKAGGTKWSELELLNGMCGWMRREVEDLQKENKEIKKALQEVRPQGNNSRGRSKEKESGGKRTMSLPENLSDLQRSKGGGGNDESKKSEVEIELEKAIKAAS